ncbi:hypothetical protein F4677DRAFT_461244 [Hypoxylon crocopeplum]|nr:hypothetical protein F4677DRAFT_461244 [Hypoxylon crocopeplum]
MVVYHPTAAKSPEVETTVYVMTVGQYFVDMFLPQFLATTLLIPIRLLDRSIKLMYPFHALPRKAGASAEESLLAKPGSLTQMINAFRHPSKDKILLILIMMLNFSAVLLAPFPSESIAVRLHGCEEGRRNIDNCALSLGLSPYLAKATLALLALTLVLIVSISIILKNWRYGVFSNPWNLGGLASLSTNAAMRAIISSFAGTEKVFGRATLNVLSSARFQLQYWDDDIEGRSGYGICPRDKQAALTETPKSASSPNTSRVTGRVFARPHHFPTPALSYWARCLFLAFLSGTLTLIVYYQSGYWTNSFETFMDSEDLGVRFLFTSIGVIISSFWEAFFSGVAIVSPHRILAASLQIARNSVLLELAIDAFTGVWAGIRRRDFYLATVAVSIITSNFLPIILGNIPSALVHTHIAHEICAWIAVALLSLMMMVLIGSFFVSWPNMPVDPGTIAGSLYYLDSTIIKNFEGPSTLEPKERDSKVREMDLLYTFGQLKDKSNKTRICVYTLGKEGGP